VQRGSRAKAWDMLFRAMAHQRLDEGAAAESWLAAACHWIEEAELVEFTPLSSGAAPWVTWYERVEVQSLLEEAGNLITAPALQPRVQALLAAMRQVRIGAPSARVSETRAAP
jgi:hypothetical protein